MYPRSRTWLWVLVLGLAAPTGCVVLDTSTVPNQPGQPSQSSQPSQPAQLSRAITAAPLAHFHDEEAEQLHLSLAAKYEKSGSWGEAAAQLEMARQANPNLDVSYRLALLYENMEQYSQALAEYNKALAAVQERDADQLSGILVGLKKLLGRPLPKSKEPALLNEIGYCLFLKGDWAGSETYLRQSLEKDPQNKRAWVDLGMTLAAENRIEESLDASQHVLSPSEAYGNIAFVQMARLQRFAEARETYKKALTLDPGNEKARRGLTDLEQIEKNEAARAATP